MEVTSLYTGLCAAMLVLLSIIIICLRYKYRLLVGDGNVDAMERAIRAQGNFLEYVPLFLFMLALLEVREVSPMKLNHLAMIMMAGRLSHAYGMLIHEPWLAKKHLLMRIPFRSAGMAATFYVLLTQIHWLLFP